MKKPPISPPLAAYPKNANTVGHTSTIGSHSHEGHPNVEGRIIPNEEGGRTIPPKVEVTKTTISSPGTTTSYETPQQQLLRKQQPKQSPQQQSPQQVQKELQQNQKPQLQHQRTAESYGSISTTPLTPRLAAFVNGSGSSSNIMDEDGMHRPHSQHSHHHQQHYHHHRTQSGGSCSLGTTEHNDPSLKEVLEKTNLQGSTRILRNIELQQESPMQSRGLFTLSFRGRQQQHHQQQQQQQSQLIADDDELPFIPTVNSTSATFSNGQKLIPSTESGLDYDAIDISTEGEEDFASLTLSYRSMTGSIQQSVRYIVQHIHRGFFADARSLTEGTIPQSVVLALCIGILCGIAAYVYYFITMYLLELVWHRIPEKYVVGVWSESYYVLWIPVVSYTCCILVGVCVVLLGEPGDLPFTISCIHHKAYIPTNHVMPMAFASIFSVVAGGSLGPEAPLVAICGAMGGFVSRKLFGQSHVNVIRKHSLMGMAGALAAFFGTPLGGSIFALEVNSRFGIEYYEHMIESIFCGEICLVVFRSLSGLPIEPIWNIHTHQNILLNVDTGEIRQPIMAMMTHAEPWTVLVGAVIGLLGAAISYVFATFHWAQMGFYGSIGLLDNKNAIYRAMLGGFCIVVIGMIIPHTMFWDEFEYETLVTMAPANELPHVWPTTGLIGFEMNTAFHVFLVGICKLIAISCSVAAGLRGGYIFPLFAAGGIFGRVLYAIFPSIPAPVAILSFSAALNVAITRTSLATTLILAFLAGEPCAIPAVLAASLCSLFATAYVPFIKTQIARSDIDHSLFHQQRATHTD